MLLAQLRAINDSKNTFQSSIQRHSRRTNGPQINKPKRLHQRKIPSKSLKEPSKASSVIPNIPIRVGTQLLEAFTKVFMEADQPIFDPNLGPLDGAHCTITPTKDIREYHQQTISELTKILLCRSSECVQIHRNSLHSFREHRNPLIAGRAPSFLSLTTPSFVVKQLSK